MCFTHTLYLHNNVQNVCLPKIKEASDLDILDNSGHGYHLSTVERDMPERTNIIIDAPIQPFRGKWR